MNTNITEGQEYQITMKQMLLGTLHTFGLGALCYINLVLWSIIFE